MLSAPLILLCHARNKVKLIRVYFGNFLYLWKLSQFGCCFLTSKISTFTVLKHCKLECSGFLWYTSILIFILYLQNKVHIKCRFDKLFFTILWLFSNFQVLFWANWKRYIYFVTVNMALKWSGDETGEKGLQVHNYKIDIQWSLAIKTTRNEDHPRY